MQHSTLKSLMLTFSFICCSATFCSTSSQKRAFTGCTCLYNKYCRQNSLFTLHILENPFKMMSWPWGKCTYSAKKKHPLAMFQWCIHLTKVWPLPDDSSLSQTFVLPTCGGPFVGNKQQDISKTSKDMLEVQFFINSVTFTQLCAMCCSVHIQSRHFHFHTREGTGVNNTIRWQMTIPVSSVNRAMSVPSPQKRFNQQQ